MRQRYSPLLELLQLLELLEFLLQWQRVRDSNPCTGLERAVS
jgi:hypothetical protein